MPASVNSAVTASTHAIVTNGAHHEQELSRARVQSSEPPSPRVSTYYDDMYRSAADSNGRYVPQQKLAPLQASNTSIHDGRFDPVIEDDPSSFDLVAGKDEEEKEYTEDSLEKTSQALFSKEHLQVIFADPTLLLGFTTFLGTHRPQSVPILVHYLDALKSLRAIHYANAICEGLDPVEGLDFTKHNVRPTSNPMLEARAAAAFDILAKEELPAFVCHQYIQIVSASITARITGSLAPDLRDASEGLAEVFTLTDPSRNDNPIVFASEEFNRTTQYGMNYIIGRNCRFLQGPMTNPTSVRRLRDAVQAGKQHHEVFLNYRRDGSPFVNLLMIAPLCDSRGVVRYHVGAQVDVSGLVKDSSDMESLQRLLDMQARGEQPPNHQKPSPEKSDELRELSEMLNQNELSTIKTFGGRMHRESREDDEESVGPQQPRLLIKDPDIMTPPLEAASGRLSGIYQHFLLVRPYPSLRVLFASPSQRVPGVLQSPFMNKIGGSNRVRDELTAAFAEGRGVTAKVRWVSKYDEEGRNKWIHCTPLIGANSQVGVWMVVIVDEQKSGREWAIPRQAPSVPTPDRSRTPARMRNGTSHNGQPYTNGTRNSIDRDEDQASAGNGSMTSLRIG